MHVIRENDKKNIYICALNRELKYVKHPFDLSQEQCVWFEPNEKMI